MSLRDYVLNEITSSIIDVVHEVFLVFVEPYTVKDLFRFIKDDTDPWAQNILAPKMKASGAIDLALNIFKKYPDECMKRITVKEMITQLEQHRPDLLPAIRTKQGIEWLTRRIKTLHSFINGDLKEQPDHTWIQKQPNGTWTVVWRPP